MLISCKILTCPCICWSNSACKILTSPCICWSPPIGGQCGQVGALCKGCIGFRQKTTHHVASSGHVASFMSGSSFMSLHSCLLCSFCFTHVSPGGSCLRPAKQGLLQPLPAAIQYSQVRGIKKLGVTSHTQAPSDPPNPVQGSFPSRFENEAPAPGSPDLFRCPWV